ncbi:hypothetical protein KKA15_01980 [Patescibacteria group bacterium]|nr:hypothetical protein [Patescibacteria group bacterium]
MSKSTIEEIKTTEIEGQDLIAKTKEEITKSIKDAEKKGKDSYDAADEKAVDQIEQILEEAKKKLQNIMAEEKSNLDKELKNLENIGARKINQAAGLVFDELKK